MAFLKVYSNGEERTVFLGNDPVILGRGEDVDVMIADKKASREHCVIEQDRHGKWRVLDLHSGNGTKLNGKRIEKAVLEPDDVITIGDARIVYAGQGAAVVAEEALPPPAWDAPDAEEPPRRAARKRSAAPLVIAASLLLVAGGVLLLVWNGAGDGKPRYGPGAVEAYNAVRNASTDKELLELAQTYLRKYPNSEHEAEVQGLVATARERLRKGTSAKERGVDFEPQLAGLKTQDAIAKLEELLKHAKREHEPALKELLTKYRDRLDAERNQLFTDLLAVFSQHVEEGEYARAREIWFFLRGDPRFEPIPSDYINRIVRANGDLETRAAAARTRLFEDVGRAESAHDFARARQLLLAAMPRYAGTSVERSLRERLAFVERALHAGVSGKPTAAPTTVAVDVEKRIKAALAGLGRRDFAGTAAALRALAESLKKDRGYLEVDARAREVEAAVHLQKLLVAKLAVKVPKKRIAKKWYVVSADENSVTVKSKGNVLTYTWAEAPAELYVTLAADVAPQEPLGFCVLAWAVGGEAALTSALDIALKEKRAKEANVFIAALVRNEKQPDGGYVVHEGKIVSRKQYHRAVEEALIKRLTGELEAAYKTIKADAALKKLNKLRDAKGKLDDARIYAKELIYDQKKYFYPYRGTGRMKEYMQVQREVDARVEKVRARWDNEKATRIKASPELTKALAKFDAAAKELEKRLIDVDDKVEEVAFLRAYFGKKFTIRNFFRTPQEKELLDYTVEVMAFNERVQGDITPTERAQVRVTNEYRIMFGHQPVRLIEALVKSSRGHCAEMSKLGYFGHFSPTPGRRTPYDRMKLEGYRYGSSENCIMGQTSPEGAHNGWCHSSGHHRNLLMPQWTEMGTGHHGRYMTQNFGQAPKWRERDKKAAKKGSDDPGGGCGCGGGEKEEDDDFDYDDDDG